MIEAAAFHGHADDASGLARHEVDGGGIGEFGGDDEIALIFARFIVGHQDEFACAEIVQGFFYG